MPERWDPAYRDTRFRRLKRAGRPVVVTLGDSWFDYPMYENIVDRLDDAERHAFHRFDASGDTAENMARHLDRFVQAVRDDRPRFVLMSAGGNDVVNADWLTLLFRPFDPALPPEEYFVEQVWNDKMGTVMGAYRTILDAVAPVAPAFGHGYDYIVPSHRGVRWNNLLVAPPQVIVALERRGIADPALQVRLAAILIDRFAGELARLQSERPGDFVHVDLRGTLTADDWENEIHPRAAGFQRLAALLGEALESRLPEVLASRGGELAGTG
jgi:lysophospholipase L1-like esterase